MANDQVFTGQRDRKIEIVKFTKTKNAINEVATAEVSVGFFWAAMKDISGNENEEGKVIHLINRTYTIPYVAEVKTGGDHMVVKDEGSLFQVYHVQELGRKAQLLLKVKVRE